MPSADEREDLALAGGEHVELRPAGDRGGRRRPVGREHPAGHRGVEPGAAVGDGADGPLQVVGRHALEQEARPRPPAARRRGSRRRRTWSAPARAVRRRPAAQLPVAATPSTIGIRTSITTTSGCEAATASTTPAPSGSSPTISKPKRDRRIPRRPARTSPGRRPAARGSRRRSGAARVPGAARPRPAIRCRPVRRCRRPPSASARSRMLDAARGPVPSAGRTGAVDASLARPRRRTATI